jgi:lipopolysaccharide export system permease protein
VTWLSRLFNPFAPLLAWWRAAPRGGSYLLLLVGIAFFLLLGTGQETVDNVGVPAGAKGIGGDIRIFGMAVEFYHELLRNFSLLTRICLGALFLYALRAMPSARRMTVPLAAVGLMLAGSLLSADLYEHWYSTTLSRMGEPVSELTYGGKLVMIAFLCISPALAFFWYARQSLLQRYTLRAFLSPLVFCFAAFFSLFVLMDLISNMRDYQESRTPASAVLSFYGQLLPSVFVMIAPWACLLATLFSFVKMSRHNEIISMLSTGQSLWQIAKPLLLVGVYVSALGVALNYHWAPHAEAQRKALTEIANSKTRTRDGRAAIADTVVYHNKETRRLWFIGRVPFDTRSESLNRVEVRQFDEQGRIEHTWLALSGKWWKPGLWSLSNGKEILYKDGLEVETRSFESHGRSTKGSTITSATFEETPWSIISASLVPDELGVSELNAYLEANHEMPKESLLPFRIQFYDRFSKPCLALLMIFAAVPFSVAFSRRAALGGMAGAMALVVGLLFLPEFFASLGKGGHMSARLAVWMPHIVFLVCGGLIFYMKSLNKEIPRFSLKNLRSWFFPKVRRA